MGGFGGLWCPNRSRTPEPSRILTPGGRSCRCQRQRGLKDQPTARGGHFRTWHAAPGYPNRRSGQVIRVNGTGEPAGEGVPPGLVRDGDQDQGTRTRVMSGPHALPQHAGARR